jgi:hypothetical protein
MLSVVLCGGVDLVRVDQMTAGLPQELSAGLGKRSTASGSTVRVDGHHVLPERGQGVDGGGGVFVHPSVVQAGQDGDAGANRSATSRDIPGSMNGRRWE